MKMQVVGFEGSEGMSKAGKPYEIGQLHVVVNLAPAFSDAGIAKGLMGTTFRCDLGLIQKIKHLQPPFMADVVIDHVMKFGKREEQVTDVVPLERAQAKQAA